MNTANLITSKRALNQQISEFGLEQPNTWLITQSFAFDASLKGLALLCQGTQCVILSSQQVLEPAKIWQEIEKQQAKVINVTPSIAGALLSQMTGNEKHLPHLIISGDDIPQSLLHKVTDYCQQHGRKSD